MLSDPLKLGVWRVSQLLGLVGMMLLTLPGSFADGLALDSSGSEPPQEGAASRHWAFQPLQAFSVPEVDDVVWPRNVIDSFVLARLEEKNLEPVADGGRATLVRRLYIDLMGLPPSPDEMRVVVNDPNPDAIAKLVDRLLASPRFGERWGRHWLDVVRFAESSGREFNFTYPHAWPYRDYVIRALNADKSFQQFVREQIAGDLLPGKPDESPEDREDRLVAAGMLAFGTKRHNAGGMTYRMEIVDDQIDVACRAILGLTVACAKCHDHKFDPIPTKDYYALAGIFLSTQPLYGTITQKYSNNPTDLIPIGPGSAERHAAAEEYEKKVVAAKKERDDKKIALTKAEEVKKEAAAKGEGDKETVREKEAVEAAIAALKAELAPFDAALADLEKNRPPPPVYAMSARDRPKPADTKVAVRGNISQPGEVAPRGFLSAVSVPGVEGIDPKQSGRLQLARWMTSPRNPLPARVVVNRIWHHLLGRGLVESVDNFGATGTPPSHRELLDTMAVEFMNEGWSVKRAIRRIVLSRTYQLGCAVDESNEQADPENRLLWRSSPRRFPVEIIRDAMLSVSGRLDAQPPGGSSVTALGDQLVRGVDTGKLQPPSNHRSVYLPVVRDYAPEMFDLFDFPSSSLVSGKRSVTNVPSQALFLRNSPFVSEQAEHAARRLMADASVDTESEKIDLAFRWCFNRAPTPEEVGGARELLQSIRESDKNADDSEVKTWSALFVSVFSTAEFRYLMDIEE